MTGVCIHPGVFYSSYTTSYLKSVAGCDAMLFISLQLTFEPRNKFLLVIRHVLGAVDVQSDRHEAEHRRLPSTDIFSRVSVQQLYVFYKQS